MVDRGVPVVGVKEDDGLTKEDEDELGKQDWARFKMGGASRPDRGDCRGDCIGERDGDRRGDRTGEDGWKIGEQSMEDECCPMEDEGCLEINEDEVNVDGGRLVADGILRW